MPSQEIEGQNSTSDIDLTNQNDPNKPLTNEESVNGNLSQIFLKAISDSLPLDPLPNNQAHSDNLAYQQALIELTAYGRQEGAQDLGTLLDRIYFLRDGYTRALKEFENPEGTQSLENYQRTLLDLREETWERTKKWSRHDSRSHSRSRHS